MSRFSKSGYFQHSLKIPDFLDIFHPIAYFIEL